MGIYLNPGSGLFKEALNSAVYVDKTEMVAYVNTLVHTSQKFLCVSRPRRFGKTMATNMLAAYYGHGSDARALFERRKLAALDPVWRDGEGLAWDAYLGAFDVIRITMTQFLGKRGSLQQDLELMAERVLEDLEEAYPEVHYDPVDLTYSMRKFYRHTGRPFVILIDEWDAPLRERRDDEAGQRLYLDFLRDWLKDQEFVALAYMTGILPIKKYGVHSALNMFSEYSMVLPQQLAEFTGFTEAEVRELCQEFRMSFDAVRDWYDGYEVAGFKPLERRDEHGEGEPERYSLYAPLSVVMAMFTGIIDNYWNNTETYEALAAYIRKDFDGLKERVALLMDGARVGVSLRTYQNDMTTFNRADDVLALLIHLGYLGYDREAGEAFVPNKEVLEVFRDSTCEQPEWDLAFREYEASKALVRATWQADADRVAEALEAAHDRAENKTYHSEAALSYAVRLAYYAARKWYSEVVELDSGKGYADVAYLPSPRHPEAPALLVELKWNHDARTALSQIRDRRYPERLAHYEGNLLLVGISYDASACPGEEGYKRHSCKIERA